MDKLQEIQDAVFSPLSKKHCLYFYAIMVFVFVILVFNVVSLLFVVITKKGKKKMQILKHGVMAILPGIVLYYQSRLMYSICVN
jgi:hypothetical protein